MTALTQRYSNALCVSASCGVMAAAGLPGTASPSLISWPGRCWTTCTVLHCTALHYTVGAGPPPPAGAGLSGASPAAAGVDTDSDSDSDTDCDENTDVLEDLLGSCCSLQHLEMEDVLLTTTMAESICKNGKTLQILNLNSSYLRSCFSSYLQIIKCCQELKEVNLKNQSQRSCIFSRKYCTKC